MDPGGLVDSKGDPHFETSNWGHSDFYVEYNGRKIDWGSSSKILFSPPFIPRYVEVVGGTLYVVAGSYQFPYSEEFERRVLDRAGIPGYDMRDVAYWQIFE